MDYILAWSYGDKNVLTFNFFSIYSIVIPPISVSNKVVFILDSSSVWNKMLGKLEVDLARIPRADFLFHCRWQSILLLHYRGGTFQIEQIRKRTEGAQIIWFAVGQSKIYARWNLFVQFYLTQLDNIHTQINVYNRLRS